MDIDVARQIYFGGVPVPPETTDGEFLQLAAGACLLDNGDIWCLTCDSPNECCTCHQMQDHDEDKFDDLDMEEFFDDSSELSRHYETSLCAQTEKEKLEEQASQYCEDCGRSECDCAEQAAQLKEEKALYY